MKPHLFRKAGLWCCRIGGMERRATTPYQAFVHCKWQSQHPLQPPGPRSSGSAVYTGPTQQVWN